MPPCPCGFGGAHECFLRHFAPRIGLFDAQAARRIGAACAALCFSFPMIRFVSVLPVAPMRGMRHHLQQAPATSTCNQHRHSFSCGGCRQGMTALLNAELSAQPIPLSPDHTCHRPCKLPGKVLAFASIARLAHRSRCSKRRQAWVTGRRYGRYVRSCPRLESGSSGSMNCKAAAAYAHVRESTSSQRSGAAACRAPYRQRHRPAAARRPGAIVTAALLTPCSRTPCPPSICSGLTQ